MSIPATDAVVIGAGACGSLVAKELAGHGLSVVVLEAGKRFDPARDLPNSEANAAKIMWTEPRVFAGPDGVAPKMGVGVGGGTLPWLGVMPRFGRADFRTHSTEGVGADWPITYDDLRDHYARVERDLGVAGECGPFAPEPYTLPMPPHRMSWHAQLLARGARALGAHPFAPPIAINSTAYDGRPACIYCGWCASGCPTGAKATALQTYLAKAEKFGARVVSEAFVYRIGYDATPVTRPRAAS
jgi:choline dehydrogenase-like flavoprotein